MSAAIALLSAGLLAMASGACLAEWVFGAMKRRAAAASMLASTPGELAAFRLKAGVRPLTPPI